MKKRYSAQEWDELRNKIIGLGVNSTKRSYYPVLQNKLAQLEKYKNLLDNFIDGLIVVNVPNGVVEDANRSALNLLNGLKIGEKIDPVLHTLKIEDEEKFKGVTEALSTGVMKNCCFNASVMINGENKTLQFRINIQEFGNVPYAVMHVSDITEKENFVQAVKKSEANLLALIENTHDLILSMNLEFGIQLMNSSFKNIFGAYCNRELKIGYNFVSCLPVNSKEKWIERCKKALQVENYSFEEQYIIKGKMIFFIVSLAPVRIEGDIKGITVFMHDITERKKYELAIEESEGQLRKIIEGSPIGIAVSKKNRLDYANSAALSIFGYNNLSEIKDKNMSDFLAAKDKKVMDDILVRTESGTYLTERLEITGITKNNEEVPLYVSITNVELYDGEAFILFFDDVSKQKEVEQTLIFAKTKAEESEKLKSEFLAQMSHEIRTPINTILSFSSLINEELKNVVSDDLKNSFESINKAGSRIIRTIDLILNMSEVQSGTNELSFTNINLFNTILIPLAKECTPRASAKGIELSIIVPPRDVLIYGDEYTIAQILTNLFDNAIKYTEKGFVKVYMENAKGEKKYSVIIEDSGIGISKEYLPALFDPFSQEERGYTRKFEGNGLGLALVKKYCELNNADIYVESEKGIGTKFIVTFPGHKE